MIQFNSVVAEWILEYEILELTSAAAASRLTASGWNAVSSSNIRSNCIHPTNTSAENSWDQRSLTWVFRHNLRPESWVYDVVISNIFSITAWTRVYSVSTYLHANWTLFPLVTVSGWASTTPSSLWSFLSGESLWGVEAGQDNIPIKCQSQTLLQQHSDTNLQNFQTWQIKSDSSLSQRAPALTLLSLE